MLGLTGFTDLGEMAKELFQLVGILELYGAAYIEADAYFTSSVYVSSNPRDRLLGYLQLINMAKRKPIGKENTSDKSTNLTAAPHKHI
jgi:hypothetical protein